MATKVGNAPMLLLLLFSIVSCAGVPFETLEDFAPDLVAAEPDFDLIAEYAGYAQAAYKPEEEIRRLYPDTVRISTPPRTETLYFLAISDEKRTQTISVRGTKNRSDILHDIAFQIVPDLTLDVSFHRGFKADALLLYEDVKPHLKRDYRTRVTGHSLGAAVSAIMMIYLQRDGYLVEPSVNFGQPKFTNTAGAERYQDLPLQRVVDDNDIVPMLPPPFLRHPRHGTYAHVGEEIVLLDGPDFVHLAEHDAERISIGEFWRDRDHASRADHRMPLYVKRIEAKTHSARQVTYAEWRRRQAD